MDIRYFVGKMGHADYRLLYIHMARKARAIPDFACHSGEHSRKPISPADMADYCHSLYTGGEA